MIAVFTARNGLSRYIVTNTEKHSVTTATIISKIEKQHPQVISSSYRTAYESAKSDFEFATIPVATILAKMNFFASIIGSILAEM